MNRVHYEPGMPFGTLQTSDLLHVSVQQKPQWKTSKNNMSSAKKSFQCCFMLLSFGKHQQRCQFCSIHANLISHSWACAHLLCVFFFKCSLQHLPPGFIQTIIKQEGNTITKLLKPPLQQQFQCDLRRNSEHKKKQVTAAILSWHANADFILLFFWGHYHITPGRENSLYFALRQQLT